MEQPKYLDFELRIEKKGQRCQVAVVRSPGGEAAGTFRWPFSDLEVENLVLRLGVVRQGVRAISTPEMQLVRQFGSRLFDSVFTGDLRSCLVSSQNEARHRGLGLRLKLRLDSPELVNVPWEYLYDSSVGRFVSLFEDTPLVRYIDVRERIQPLPTRLPLSVLVMISSPVDYTPLDVVQERANLEEALKDLVDQGLFKITWMEKPTLPSLAEYLLRGQYHIFHYVGHGGFGERSQDGLLVLEDENGRSRLASGERLAVLLGNELSLRLVILNSCEGARTSSTDPFAGTATTLVRTGRVPAVVAMQFRITDTAAITFARGFYTALSMNRPVDAAVTQARLAIFAAGNDVEWGTPVLYTRAPDGAIFDLEELDLAELAALRQAAQAARQKAEAELQRRAEERRIQEQRQAHLSDLYAQADACLADEGWEKAVQLLSQIIEIDPGYLDAVDKLDQARTEQTKVEQIEASLVRADEYMAQDQWSQAAATYRQILEWSPGQSHAHTRLVEAERQERISLLVSAARENLQAGCWEEAIAGFQAVLDLDPDHGDAARLLGQAQESLHKQVDEEAAQQERAAHQARLARLYTGADSAAQSGDWARAADLFREVLALDSAYGDAVDRLAQAQQSLAAQEAARRQEERLASLYEQSRQSIRASDWKRAVQLLDEIRLEDPEFRDVAVLYEQAVSEREREEKLQLAEPDFSETAVQPEIKPAGLAGVDLRPLWRQLGLGVLGSVLYIGGSNLVLSVPVLAPFNPFTLFPSLFGILFGPWVGAFVGIIGGYSIAAFAYQPPLGGVFSGLLLGLVPALVVNDPRNWKLVAAAGTLVGFVPVLLNNWFKAEKYLYSPIYESITHLPIDIFWQFQILNSSLGVLILNLILLPLLVRWFAGPVRQWEWDWHEPDSYALRKISSAWVQFLMITLGWGAVWGITWGISESRYAIGKGLSLEGTPLTCGTFIGLVLWLVLRQATHFPRWRYGLLISVGWVIALQVVGSTALRYAFSNRPLDLSSYTILALAGLTGGLATGLALRWARGLAHWWQVLLVAIGWGAAMGLGTFVSIEGVPVKSLEYLFWMNLRFILIGLLAGAIGGGITLWLLSLSRARSEGTGYPANLGGV